MLIVSVSEYENRWALPDRHSAILWGKARNKLGLKVVLDILEENAKDNNEATKNTAHYLDLIRHLHKEKMYAAIAVKVSALGYTWDENKCLQNVLSIAREAAVLKVGFEIDMEGTSMVGFTLETVKAVTDAGFPVTSAL